ncbi:MAG: T9SS type A sorting domain-containing protein [candidate division Zixibacteria bacterium]|nr:T9SS type A sorting domain-containing protein [candidate division Zixibacteria bacterium]
MRYFFMTVLSVLLIASFAIAADREVAPGFEPSGEILAEGDVILGPIDIEAPTGDNQILGCEFADGHYWFTGAGATADPNKVYKFDTNWNLVQTTDQPSYSTGWGWRDMCYDGQYLYASVTSTVDEIDPATGLATGNTFPGPQTPNRALAYDPATDHFWTANFSSNIYEFDRSGTVINSYTNSQSTYGMALDDECPTGPWLWVHNQNGGGMLLEQFDPAAGTYTGTSYDVTVEAGIAGGAAPIVYDAGAGPKHTILVVGQANYDLALGMELCDAGPPPDWNMSCSFSIITPYVPSVNGDIEFMVSGTNIGANTIATVIGEIYPTIGDCASGTEFDFNLTKVLATNLANGQSFSGYYFYHVVDVSGLGLTNVAINFDVGKGVDDYLCEGCDEFLFYNPWGRTGGEVNWGTEWREIGEGNLPTATALGQNYPNPFNANTSIPFELADNGNVSVKVYNVSGQLVETLIDGYMEAGSHVASWDASTVSSGVYFYTLETGDYSTTKKMNLLK